jgi:hypothetical protein
MRRHTTAFVMGVLLAATGFAAAAIASGSGVASALQTTATTTSVATTTEQTTTTTPPAKITICHHARGKNGATKHVTIRISQRAWKAHQRHGDTLGACSAARSQRIHSSKAHAKKFHKKAKAKSGKGKGR